jgi:transcription antitermination protein NusB
MADRPERTDREDRRSESRERALTLLYEAEAKAQSGEATLHALPVAADDMATKLVQGVDAHRVEIDELIRKYSRTWTLERMPVIDRSVLRIAIFELLASPDVPIAVILDEAVELAKSYGTDDSGKFVNGMLSSIAAHVRP